MILTDHGVDAGRTNPALYAITTAPMLPIAQAATQTATQATAQAITARFGVPSPRKRPLTRRLAAPAPVTLPLAAAAKQSTQGARWRARAIHLALGHGASCAATYLGRSARGAECYRVPNTTRWLAFPLHYYRVSITPTLETHCECLLARQGHPCLHAGAALLLDERRGMVAASIEIARQERVGWAYATHYDDALDGGTAYYRVAQAQGRRWDYLTVVFDTINHVALWCDCGATVGCAHIGAVALRDAKERADTLAHAIWH